LTENIEYIDHDFTYFYSLNMPWGASKMNCAPLAEPNDGKNDIVTSRV
jgi:hypothetical protein